jgi:hypothetical protein
MRFAVGRTMSPTQEEFMAELESLGIGRVKERIATKVYLGGSRDIAQGWVDRQEAASNVEQMDLARQATNATRTSNKIALSALVIAMVSLIVSIFGFFRH